MKFFRYIFLLMIFSYIVFSLYSLSKKQQKKLDGYLDNNIVFEGLVTNLKKSRNHAFGIIELKITKSNAKVFSDSVQEGIFPYKIREGTAEVYCTVSVERKLNDTLKVISNNHLIYFNPLFSKEVGSLKIITDSFNRNFVKENSVFNN